MEGTAGAGSLHKNSDSICLKNNLGLKKKIQIRFQAELVKLEGVNFFGVRKPALEPLSNM